MTATLAAGATFAGYRVDSLVARGGMGVVYRASDLSLERPVALKLIAPELAEDGRFRQRFLKESRLAASLDHPSVVPVYEAGEHDGALYIVMRFVEGRDLRTLLRRDGTLGPERSLPLLAQIAQALDAAHRRGLVHRDVKPGNVLVDDDGHAYLTDFGVSKRLGGDSTDTGRMVGTLDYLAPEQIRGQPVDGRADQYALACVLYECLAGRPPFGRESEGETLWAHMQEDPAPLAGHPALDPVLAKGLAKTPDDRYETCGALIDAALGSRSRVPRALLRRRHAILAAGLVVLAATVAVALSVGGGGSPPAGSGVLAISADGRLDAFTRTLTAPSNIAVGEGAVWVLNSDDETVARIDPKTRKVVKTFAAGGIPTDLAVGGGAVWIGRSNGTGWPYGTDSIARIDPGTGSVTRDLVLPLKRPGESGGPASSGFPRIAVGAGAVWVANPGASVSRVDPGTGRLVKTIETGFPQSTIAAGPEGVWFLSWDSPRAIRRIDPRTNRVAETIPVTTDFLAGIAVGAGAVWATSPQDGQLWRIEPGPSPRAQTIHVGVGVNFVAFGAGAVWTGNFIDGTVTRIDPDTKTVTDSIPVGATQALAAGAGSGWTSVAAGTQDGTLPVSMCAETASGGREPDVLIASDLPLRGSDGAAPRALRDAIRQVLEAHAFKAGKYAVGYRSCDGSTAQTGAPEMRRCGANANAYAHAKRLVAVIGPFNSFCAAAEIPILNRAPGGPLAIVGPSTSDPALTRADRGHSRAVEYKGSPGVFYPTGDRNFLRMPVRDDLQGVAQAMLAKELGLHRVYVLTDRKQGLHVAAAEQFVRAAPRLGIAVAGAGDIDTTARSYDTLADKVARSRADGVLLSADQYSGGGKLLTALRARLGSREALIAGEGFTPITDLREQVGRAARGLYVTVGVLPPDAARLSPTQKRFVGGLGETAKTEYLLHVVQATEVVLAAIARSDGSRASVLRELKATRVRDGVLGSFRFDRNGDITPAKVTVLRVTGHTPADLRLPGYLAGAVVHGTITVPANLAG
jgi:ABC-type branched-subunit amino acid transport system substrate-binding protein/DNA-binding beta-propeller fold protein YncE